MEKKELDGLFAALKRGDERAFEKIYIGTRKGIFAYLYSFTGDYQRTQDTLQDTYLKVRRSICGYREGSNPTAWLFSVARSVALSEIQRNNRVSSVDMSEYEPPECACEVDVGSGELIELIRDSLPPQDAKIVLLHILGGYKHKEIARLIDVPLGTVLWKYNRSIKRLKEILKEEEYR